MARVLDVENGIFREEGAHDLVRGIVRINEKGKFVMGNFGRNSQINYPLIARDGTMKITRGAIDHKNYTLSKNFGGYFYNKDADNVRTYTEGGVKGTYSVKTDYSIGYRLKEFQDYSRKNPIDSSERLFYERLDAVSVGIEYESAEGMIPEPLCFENRMVPVKDGSLRRNEFEAFEYATIPMASYNMYTLIKKQCEVLKTFCKKSNNEAIHVHVGCDTRGGKPTYEQALSIYKVAIAVQDELYEMVPLGMRNTGEWKRTGTNYCSPLKKFALNGTVDQDYKKLFNYLTSGHPDNSNFDPTIGQPHPNDRAGRQKWNIGAR